MNPAPAIKLTPSVEPFQMKPQHHGAEKNHPLCDSNSWPIDSMGTINCLLLFVTKFGVVCHTLIWVTAPIHILVNSPFIKFFPSCPVWWGCIFPDRTLWDTKGVPQMYHRTDINKLLLEYKVKRIHFQVTWSGKSLWRQEPCMFDIPDAQ